MGAIVMTNRRDLKHNHDSRQVAPTDFDAGELFTIIPSDITEETFSNVSIDPHSMRFIDIACRTRPTVDTPNIRFAIVGFIEVLERPQTPKLHLVFYPTVETLDTQKKMDYMEEIFGKGNVIRSRDGSMPGLVHQDTIEIVLTRAKLAESRHEQNPFHFLFKGVKAADVADISPRQLNVPMIGLSCIISNNTLAHNKIFIQWTGRSTMQYDVFKFNLLADFCFLLDRIKPWDPRNYTTSFSIERSIPIKQMDAIVHASQSIIKKDIPILQNQIVHEFGPDTQRDSYASKWHSIRKSKSAIQSFLEDTVMKLASLNKSTPGPMWPKHSDSDQLRRLFSIADEHGIKALKLGTALQFAVDKQDIDMVVQLVERGAKLQTARLHKDSKADDMTCINYINSCIKIKNAVAEGDLDKLKALLDENVYSHADSAVNLSKPIDNYMTPLAFAVEANNLKAADLILSYGIKIDEILEPPMTALSLALEKCHFPMISLLLQKGASIDLALKLLENSFKNPPPLMRLWISSDPLDIELKNYINKVFKIIDTLVPGPPFNQLYQNISAVLGSWFNAGVDKLLTLADLLNANNSILSESDDSRVEIIKNTSANEEISSCSNETACIHLPSLNELYEPKLVTLINAISSKSLSQQIKLRTLQTDDYKHALVKHASVALISAANSRDICVLSYCMQRILCDNSKDEQKSDEIKTTKSPTLMDEHKEFDLLTQWKYTTQSFPESILNKDLNNFISLIKYTLTQSTNLDESIKRLLMLWVSEEKVKQDVGRFIIEYTALSVEMATRSNNHVANNMLITSNNFRGYLQSNKYIDNPKSLLVDFLPHAKGCLDELNKITSSEPSDITFFPRSRPSLEKFQDLINELSKEYLNPNEATRIFKPR
jgi:hypothetical protein